MRPSTYLSLHFLMCKKQVRTLPPRVIVRIHFFDKYLQRTYCIPGTVLSAGDEAKRMKQIP